MKYPFVRLKEITIQNFKNVEYGTLSFENKRKDYKASILGLYGQNGSGKTALIDTVRILKYALCGRKIPSEAADYINVNAEYAELKYLLSVITELGEYSVTYKFKLHKEKMVSEQNIETDDPDDAKTQIAIYDEVLSYSFANEDTKERKAPIIDTGAKTVFSPETKYECLIGKDKDIMIDLMIAKKMAYQTSRSFIFSRELNQAIQQRADQQKHDEEFVRHYELLQRMIQYGHWELFVIDTSDAGIISLNAQPLAFRVEDKTINQRASGIMVLPLDQVRVMPKEDFDIIKKIIDNMNIVLQQLIPGLTIGLKELNHQMLKNGEDGVTVQLMSYKNKKEIPLKYESEGIKKIIAVLQLLIVVYNQSSITVAIDELDSGIFEYLLGEILHIISEKGKGQLIFTSHNLRPLETIDRGFIAFTTTNPSNRYVKMAKVKDNNNLRDLYYRNIILEEQAEDLYELTNNAEIAFAFREAGEEIGS